jgi:hypothetical protein
MSENGAMRSLGPGRSTSTPTVRPSSALTRRTRSMSASWAAGTPCERLMRMTSAPAAITFLNTGSSHEAGPMDATILVRRTACPSVCWFPGALIAPRASATAQRFDRENGTEVTCRLDRGYSRRRPGAAIGSVFPSGT